MLTVSDRSVIALLENLGTDFDKNVLEWRDALDSSINKEETILQVIYTLLLLL